MEKNQEQERIENLLKPRYKVIADYPASKFTVGGVLSMTRWNEQTEWYVNFDGYNWNADYFELYPHLFRKLEWYEERTVEEMPEYVKTNPSDTNWNEHFFSKVEGFYGDSNEYISLDGLSDEHQYCTDWFLPATLKEYTTYIKQ